MMTSWCLFRILAEPRARWNWRSWRGKRCDGDALTSNAPLARSHAGHYPDVPEDTDIICPWSRLAQLTVIDAVLATGFTLRRGQNSERLQPVLRQGSAQGIAF